MPNRGKWSKYYDLPEIQKISICRFEKISAAEFFTE